MDFRERLFKYAGLTDYLLKHDMTKADHDRLQAVLDQQGIPRHKGTPGRTQPELQHGGEHVPLTAESPMYKAMEHIKRNKGRYALGAASLAGIGLLYKHTQNNSTYAEEPQQQGF